MSHIDDHSARSDRTVMWQPAVPPSCILRAAFALPHHALAHACRARSMTHDQLCATIGAGAALTLLSQA